MQKSLRKRKTSAERNVAGVINISGVLAHEAQQGDVFSCSQSYRTGGDGAAGDYDPEACLDDLLQVIFRDAAAGENNGLPDGNAVFQSVADDLVQSVVTADVLHGALKLAVCHQCTAVGAAGGLEQVAGIFKHGFQYAFANFVYQLLG